MRGSNLLVACLLFGPAAASAQGWAVFASGGDVYRAEAGSVPEVLYTGGVDHATWSADALRVFFIKTNGEIWSMYNDGSGAKRIDSGVTTAYCPIGPYRPDPEFVLYVEGDTFYRIQADTGERTLIQVEPRNYVGEIAISADGTRISGRGTDSNLYAIPVGGTSVVFSPDCSASISPDGAFLTANVPGHMTLRIHLWDGSVYTTLTVPPGAEWDNQKFVVNSNDWVVYRHDLEAAIGIVRVSDNQNVRVCDLGSDYPDFFLGDLPEVPGDNQPPTAGIDLPPDGEGYEPGDTLTYAGHADDPEDGSLSGGALVWELDRVGDGLGPVHMATGTTGSYVFPADISENTAYELRLIATDTGGLSDTAQISVWVRLGQQNAPPVITSVSANPNPAGVGVEVTFACVATDPDGDPLSYAWSFGDGASLGGNPVSHVYREPGDYVANVTVDDGNHPGVSAPEIVAVVDPGTFVLEAEDMFLDGYEIEGEYIATYTTGIAWDTFHGPPDTYRVKIVIIKEDDGRPTLEVFLGGVQVANIHYPQGASNRDPEAVDVGVHAIDHDGEIRLRGCRHEGAAARVDKIFFLAETLVEEDGGTPDGSSDAGHPSDAGPGDAGSPQDAGFPDAEDDAGHAGDDGADPDAAPDAMDAGPADSAQDAASGDDEEADAGQNPGEVDQPSRGCGCGTSGPRAPWLMLFGLACFLRRPAQGTKTSSVRTGRKPMSTPRSS